MTYQVEHFYAAVATLAGDGHIKHRLIRAYQDNLDSIDDLELPITLKETFAELKSRMYTVTPLKGEGAIRSSVRKLAAREASACAIPILSLDSDMLQL